MRFCPDCQSTHMGINPCGLTYAQRLRSVRLDQKWMERDKRNYYDDEALKGLFSDDLTGKERAQELAEETQGVGVATMDEIRRHPDLAAAHYLDNPHDDDREVIG